MFQAWFTGNIFPLIFEADTWKYALDIAKTHETTISKLLILQMMDIQKA